MKCSTRSPSPAPPEHVAELARRVLAAGADRIDFGTPHGRTDAEGVELLGTRVLPLLRSA
jgi:5,10-methylenetetrahydromethanopterin reductase